MSDPSNIRFTQDYVIKPPRPQGIYPISEGHWGRLKRMVGQTAPRNRVFQNLGSALAGVSASGFFAALGFGDASSVEPWIITTAWAVVVGSAVLATSFFFMDYYLDKRDVVSMQRVLEEMESIEGGFLDLDELRPERQEELWREVEEWARRSQGEFSPSDRVVHSTFGEGVVQTSSVRANGDEVIEVEFQDYGRKKLLTKFADLKRLKE